MISPEIIPFTMITEEGRSIIDVKSLLQGISIAIVSGGFAAYILLIRIDERIQYITSRQNDMLQIIKEVQADTMERFRDSQADRRALSERVSKLEAIEIKETHK